MCLRIITLIYRALAGGRVYNKESFCLTNVSDLYDTILRYKSSNVELKK